MTRSIAQTEYISRFDTIENLEGYGDHLKDKGLKDLTVRTKVQHIARCAKIISESDNDRRIEEIGKDEFMIVRKSLRKMSARAVNAYTFDLGEFVQHICGLDSNPVFIYRVVGQYDNRDIDEIYRTELAALRDTLLKQNLSAGYRNEVLCEVRVCLTALANHYGPIPVNTIGIEHFRYLYATLPLSKTSSQVYLPSLGRFTAVVTGNNIFLDYRDCGSGDRFQERIDQLDFSDAFRDYLAWLTRRGCRPKTIESRSSCLMTVFSLLERTFGRCDRAFLESIDDETLYLFRDSISDRKESTVRKYLTDLGCFLEFLTGENPYRMAKMMWNDGEVYRTWIDKVQWKLILDNATPLERLAIMLAGTIGMRVSEIADLRLDDIEGNVITIRGKGHGPNGKVMSKKMGKTLVSELQMYMAHRQSIIDAVGDQSEGHLLISDGRYKGIPCTEQMLMSGIRHLSDRLGFKFSFHTFRRMYATSLYDAGVDDNTLRLMMRHQSLETTYRCYIDADPRRIADAEDKLEEELFG